ncbi:MAG: DUF1080 domain-containing protein [Bacteroidales bacterium]|nr:DUF1080 domain-containing protein [Bacteroidales bacterium]
MKRFLTVTLMAVVVVACTSVKDFELQSGDSEPMRGTYTDFLLTGQALLEDGADASVWFHTDDDCAKGYQVLFRNGPIDGTRKTGSLASVRNLYRSLASDGEWFPFEIAVRGNNISVRINGTDVVCYTEPEKPYRSEKHKHMLLGGGKVIFTGGNGKVSFRNVTVEKLPADQLNPADSLPPVDEQTDDIIRLQQEDFPVIDWHVHLKGDLTEEMAHAMSMNYGINYGIGPNAYGPKKEGEGGSGLVLTSDEEMEAYWQSVKDWPFMRSLQGDGRKWSRSFSPELLDKFDYIFTDAMYVFDHGRLVRLWYPDEVRLEMPVQKYMDLIVDETVNIFENDPADFSANAFYLPDAMAGDFERLWTDERVDRVLKVLKENNVALEISARYLIPSKRIILKAKDMGLKFTFGTNNKDSDFGRLEYCTEMVRECGITAEDMWFPAMSTRSERMKARGAAENRE